MPGCGQTGEQGRAAAAAAAREWAGGQLPRDCPRADPTCPSRTSGVTALRSHSPKCVRRTGRTDAEEKWDQFPPGPLPPFPRPRPRPLPRPGGSRPESSVPGPPGTAGQEEDAAGPCPVAPSFSTPSPLPKLSPSGCFIFSGVLSSGKGACP